jgi:hypothetical protein
LYCTIVYTVLTFQLRVEAYDLGIPTPLSSDLDLSIYVRNVNDHQPQFLIDEFTINFTGKKVGWGTGIVYASMSYVD